MKTKIFNRSCILAAAALSLAMMSCEKAGVQWHSGDEVRFAAVSGSADTKAAYSGVSAAGKERIDWQPGDMIRIHCAEASAPDDHHADYSVSTVDAPSSGSAVSTAHIAVSGGVGLRWGDESASHHFYAVYPSPSAGGATQSISANTITATIPAVQSIAGTVSQADGNYVATPDLKSMVMTAKTVSTPAALSDEEVFLGFTSLTTAIQFVIKNDSGSEMKLTQVQLISGNGKTSAEPVISGAFSIDLDRTGVASGTEVKPFTGNDYTITYGQDYPLCTCTAATSTNQASDRTLTIVVGTDAEPLKLAVGKTFTFTFFLNPVNDFNDLTFKLVKAGGSWQSTRLGYTDGDGIFFPRHKKSTVAGLLIPEGAVWRTSYDADVLNWEGISNGIDMHDPVLDPSSIITPWDSGITEEMGLDDFHYVLSSSSDEVTFRNTSATQTKDIWIRSARIVSGEHDAIKEAVPFNAEYSIDDGATWLPYDASATGVSGFDAENNPGFSDFSETSLTARARGIDRSGKFLWEHDNVFASDWDLSKCGVGGEFNSSNPVNTSNCYIVKHPGSYRIPLVYGNSVKNGVAVTDGYVATGVDPHMLQTMVNAQGNGIQDAYVLSDLSLEPNTAPVNPAAALLWCDAKENGELLIDDVCLHGSGESAYISFSTCSAENMVEGNAVIVLYDDADADGYDEGEALWSWHIWVSAQALTSDDTGTVGSVSFMPCNVGFCSRNIIRYETDENFKTFKVRLTQTEGDASPIIITINQPDTIETENEHSPYYEFGRKDPYVGNTGSYSTAEAFYGPDGEVATMPVGGASLFPPGSSNAAVATSTLAKFIRYPGTYSVNNLMTDYFLNLWSLNMTEPLVKTVYDPSPYGYRLASKSEFEVLCSFGEWIYDDCGMKFYGDDRLYFPGFAFLLSGSGALGNNWTSCRYWTGDNNSTAGGWYLFCAPSNLDVRSNNGTAGFSVRSVLE